MKGASVEHVKGNFAEYLSKCTNEGPVVITRAGKPVAVLVAPLDKDDLERLVLSHSPRFQAIISKSRKSLMAGKGIPHDEFWRVARETARRKSRPRRAKRAKGDAA
jgi:prevent-host-death family protein